jgi:hypothetical protein
VFQKAGRRFLKGRLLGSSRPFTSLGKTIGYSSPN